MSDEDGITLGEALKATGLYPTGGAAKRAIQAGEVRVNREVETRRKRRLQAGDVIEAEGETFEIDREEDAEPPAEP